MAQLPVMRPGSVFDLGNKLRADEDSIPLPSGFDGRFRDDQLAHLLPELRGRSFVKAGPNTPDIDQLVSFARGKEKASDATER
jgi:hypothetical protein